MKIEKQKSVLFRIADNRIFCLAWLIICTVFVTWFAMLRVPLEGTNPVEYSAIFEKTASVIAVSHPKLYYLYVLFTVAAVYLNISYMYRHNNYAGKLGKALMYISFISVVLTIVFPHADSGIPKLIHWSLALIFAFANAAAIILFLVSQMKGNIKYLGTLIIFGSLPVVMITLLLVFGENGAIEILPMWISCLIFFLVNYTNFYKTKTKAEKSSIQAAI